MQLKGFPLGVLIGLGSFPVIFLVGLVVALGSSLDDPDKPSPPVISRAEAEVRCRRELRNRLKDPGSLEAPRSQTNSGIAKIGIINNEDGWVILGSDPDSSTAATDAWVVQIQYRARNSFNALTPGMIECFINPDTGRVIQIKGV